MNIKPKDIIKTELQNGVEQLWEVQAVMLGGTSQQGVVEVKPITQKKGSGIPTRIPWEILESAISGKVETKLYPSA